MKIRPLRNLVLVKIDRKRAVADGGLIIPDMLQDQPERGTAIACGPEVLDVKPGDRLVFGKWNGQARLERSMVIAMGYEPDDELYLMRETHEMVQGAHRIQNDDIYGIEET